MLADEILLHLLPKKLLHIHGTVCEKRHSRNIGMENKTRKTKANCEMRNEMMEEESH